jgi:hypothetical protein
LQYVDILMRLPWFLGNSYCPIYNIEVVEISGDWSERFEQAVEHIDHLIATHL